MAILVFESAAVSELVSHAAAATEHQRPYGEEKGFPSLLLVHDDGVYLMSSGVPGLSDPDREGRAKVVHAKGTNPTTDEDHYETARALVGGDDFVEHLPLEAFDDALKHPVLRIKLTATKVEILVPGTGG